MYYCFPFSIVGVKFYVVFVHSLKYLSFFFYGLFPFRFYSFCQEACFLSCYFACLHFFLMFLLDILYILPFLDIVCRLFFIKSIISPTLHFFFQVSFYSWWPRLSMSLEFPLECSIFKTLCLLLEYVYLQNVSSWSLL